MEIEWAEGRRAPFNRRFHSDAAIHSEGQEGFLLAGKLDDRLFVPCGLGLGIMLTVCGVALGYVKIAFGVDGHFQ